MNPVYTVGRLHNRNSRVSFDDEIAVGLILPPEPDVRAERVQCPRQTLASVVAEATR